MLRPVGELNSASLSDLGVGIFRVTEHQHHVAFLYEASDGQIYVSHLRTHHFFRGRDPVEFNYWWSIVLGMEAVNRKVFASWLESLSLRPLKIGYGFSDQGCKFAQDANGDTIFVSTAPGKGLTCATFIIAALEFNAHPSWIVRETWPRRQEDDRDQAGIRDDLRQAGCMTEAELDLLSEDIGSVRFRPIEVTAACAHNPWPVDFATATVLANQILTNVAELRLAARAV
jgi:hypothetical protein